jgi:hypothetical protein
MDHIGFQAGVFERAEGKGADPCDSLFTHFPVFVFTHGVVFNAARQSLNHRGFLVFKISVSVSGPLPALTKFSNFTLERICGKIKT